MSAPVDVLAVPKLIGKRTKEGDRVFDGAAVFEVATRVADMLILRPERAEDYHYYVRWIGSGKSARFSSYAAALNAIGLPATVEQLDAALAVTQQMLSASGGDA